MRNNWQYFLVVPRHSNIYTYIYFCSAWNFNLPLSFRTIVLFIRIMGTKSTHIIHLLFLISFLSFFVYLITRCFVVLVNLFFSRQYKAFVFSMQIAHWTQLTWHLSFIILINAKENKWLIIMTRPRRIFISLLLLFSVESQKPCASATEGTVYIYPHRWKYTNFQCPVNFGEEISFLRFSIMDEIHD